MIAFTFFIFLTGRWDYLGYPVRFWIFLPPAAAIIRSFLSITPHTPFAALVQPGRKNAFFSYLVPVMILTVVNALALQGNQYSQPTLALDFPLKNGTFYIAQAGSSTLVNYHHPSAPQIYALDVVQLNPWGLRANGLGQTALDQYQIFDAVVYSPCEGSIGKAVDGFHDIAPGEPGDLLNPAGNHLYIICGQTQILLAHLKEGSLLVKMGDPVTTGMPLARVGNSGNSNEPHLHIHAQTAGNLLNLNSGAGIPITFDNRFLVRNDTIEE